MKRGFVEHRGDETTARFIFLRALRNKHTSGERITLTLVKQMDYFFMQPLRRRFQEHLLSLFCWF